MSFGARFLTDPDLFPARIAGERWGDDEIVLDLAGGPFRVTGLSPRQRESLAMRFGEANVTAPFEIIICRAAATDFRELDTRGWEYSLDIEPHAIAGMRLMSRIDLDRARAAIWTCVDDVPEFFGVVENVLRPLVATLLLANGGLLVHSTAAEGFLFAGQSGAGKSTIARLAVAAGRAVLSDDLNAVVPRGDGFALTPLPFTGDLTREQLSNLETPLRAIVRLEKGDHEAVRAMSRAETVSLLVRSAPYVNLDPARGALLLERAANIAARATTAILTFRRDANVWPILDKLCP
jgi:hypothetical protein